MIRLYTYMIERIILCMIFIRFVTGTDYPEVMDAVRRWARTGVSASDSPSIITMKEFAYRILEGRHDDPKYAELKGRQTTMFEDIAEIGVQYSQSRSDLTSGDTNLIDAMIKALQLPYIQNRLNNRVLKRLRQALLLPSEMGGLVARLQSAELSCAECGHMIASGEGVSLWESTEDNYVIKCHACIRPLLIACDCCNSKFHFDRKWNNLHSQTIVCPTHKKDPNALSNSDQQEAIDINRILNRGGAQPEDPRTLAWGGLTRNDGPTQVSHALAGIPNVLGVIQTPRPGRDEPVFRERMWTNFTNETQPLSNAVSWDVETQGEGTNEIG